MNRTKNTKTKQMGKLSHEERVEQITNEAS